MNPPGTPGSSSREKVRCIHCDSEMERRNLKSNTLRVHAGKSPSEKLSAGRRTLSFSVKTLKWLHQVMTMKERKGLDKMMKKDKHLTRR